MSFPYGTTVTLVRRVLLPAKDAYGNDQWSTTQTPLTGCAVWPTGSVERQQGQDVVTTGLTALLPAGTVVAATDKVTVAGLDYEVDGDPARFTDPFSNFDPGVEVRLKRVTG